MFIQLYVIALPIFFVIDLIWVGFIAKNFYRQQIGYLMKDQFNWSAAMLFYLLFIGGLVFFVISPAIEKKSWMYALLSGALFGFITYATYDLTNLATVKEWPVLVTVVDLTWGAVLAASVATITYLVVSKINL